MWPYLVLLCSKCLAEAQRWNQRFISFFKNNKKSEENIIAFKMKINVVPKLTSTHPLQGSVPDKIDLSDPHQNPPDLGVEMFEINVPQNIPQVHSKAEDTLF